MCGITGIQVFSEQAIQRLEAVHAATLRLEKRGPDDTGTFTHHRTALGHRRLSIIDISKAGAQPFTDETGRYTLVLNGEFFNYREHRENLLSKGIKFRSGSDTEVLLQLWMLEKEACLSKINGFFAFAVYDRDTGSLCLVRDRYGVKPLLYSIDDEKIVFGSELKAVLEYGVSRELDHTSLQLYLHLNYIPAPDSIFKSVKKLEPGCMLFIQNGICKKQVYYQLHSEAAEPPPSYEAAKRTVLKLLEEAVQRRLVSDVPLGSFLSGGVDSSLVTALAATHTPRLKTFSIGFPDEPFFDETRYAELVSQKYKTDHTVFAVKNEDLFEHMHAALGYLDEPFADSSALLVFILCKKTRREVTVALSGDGADELFTGYNKHAAEYRLRHQGLTEMAAKAGAPLWDLLPKSRNTAVGNKIRQLQKFSAGMRLSPADRYWRWAGFTDKNAAAELLLKPAAHEAYEKRKHRLTQSLDAGFNGLLQTDFNLVLQNDMLVKTDLMSMANGLELRSPFLDFKLVDYVFSLPEEYKIDKHTRKKILKDACAHVLPPEILARRKQGFEVPLLKWFKSDLKSLIFDDLLSEEYIRAQGIFNYKAVGKLKEQLLSPNPGDSVARIWALIVFQFWWKQYASFKPALTTSV